MTATIDISASKELEAELLRLEAAARSPALIRGLRAGGAVVAKRLRQILPKPGYPGDKPGFKPLRDTVKAQVKEYQQGSVVVAVVGYEWGAGSHGHLVEYGHDIVTGGSSPASSAARQSARVSKTGRRGKGVISGRVEGRYYLKSASESTRPEQDQAMLAAIQAAVSGG